MKPARFLFLSLFLAGMLAVSLGAVAFGKEVWPVCIYRMFAQVRQPDSLTRLRVYGVPAKEPGREIALVSPGMIRPFDPSRLQRALARMEQKPDRDRLFKAALLDLGLRYERLRLQGRHRSPPLKSLRLYRVTWRLDPDVRNVDRPDERELLAEVRLPDA